MLYPTKAPCWIHWLLRAVCAHPGHLCSETAIFFIYLLIIYPACPAKGKKSDDSTCMSHRFFFLLSEDASRAERSRVSEILRLLQKALPPDMFSFACQKRTRKAPATFEAREAAGCGSLRLLRALRGTRILQAAAPTAPPCFGHWPRSSPLQTRGYSPLVTPMLLGSIQKIQVASLKDFLCCADFKSLTRRNARATAYFHADANAPAGSQRQQIPFAVTTFPVKKQIRKIRRSS